MSTIKRQACERNVDDLIKGNPAVGVFLFSLLSEVKIPNKLLPQDFVDIVVQKHYSYDIYDMFNLAHLQHCLKTGRIAVFYLPVESTPPGDKLKSVHNGVLKNLPYPFRGRFWGGTQGSDGYIEWEKPINAVVQKGDVAGYAIIPPHRMPLEVGTTEAEKTYHYVCPVAYTGGGSIPGVARWPYGHEGITLISNTFSHAGDDGFEELVDSVFGEFDSFPNPLDRWNEQMDHRHTRLENHDQIQDMLEMFGDCLEKT